MTWDAVTTRVGRAVPALGLAVGLVQASGRLDEARLEDAAYRKIMASMGAVPKLPHGTEQQVWHELAGEVIGHLVALAVGGGLLSLTSADLVVTLIATWMLACATDWIGGKAGRAWSSRAAQRDLES